MSTALFSARAEKRLHSRQLEHGMMAENDPSSRPNKQMRSERRRTSSQPLTDIDPQDVLASQLLSPSPLSDSASSDHPRNGVDQRELNLNFPKVREFLDVNGRDAESESEEVADNDVEQDTQSGTIEQVELINFMCHKMLRVNLGPKLNFITGANGSGKSTILTAISTALGGRAASTGRSSSVKGLILQGERQACVKVRICNSGSYGYRRDFYGDYIEVEKRINQTAGATLKIRGAKDNRPDSNVREKRPDRSPKAELLEILEHFRIRIDNPFTILTQDKARSFLTSATVTEKYRFYEEGLGFDQIKYNLDKTVHTIKESAKELESKKQQFKQAQHDSRRLKENYQKFTDILKMQEEYNKKLCIVEWDKVTRKENSLQKLEVGLAKHEKSVAEKQQEVSDLNDKLSNAEQEMSELEKSDELEKLEAKWTAADSELKAAHDIEREARLKYESHDVHHKELTKQIAMLLDEQQANEKKKRQLLVDKGEDELLKLEEELAKLKRLLDDEDGVKIDTDRLAETESMIVKVEEDKKRFALEKESLRKRIASLEDDKRKLSEKQTTGNGRINKDTKHIKLMKLVDQNVQIFKKRPIGPVMNYIKIRPGFEEWHAELECLLDDLLETYIVFSGEDYRSLRRLAENANLGAINISIVPDDIFDYKHNMPDKSHQYDIVNDVLEIDNEHVRRLLINGKKIESTILVRNAQDGRQLMIKRDVKVSSCISHLNDEKYVRIRNNMGLVIDKLQLKRSFRISVQNEAIIEQIEAVISHEGERLVGLLEKHRHSFEELDGLRRLKSQLEKKIDSSRRTRETREKKVEDIQEMLASRRDDADIQEVDEEIKRLQETLDTEAQSLIDSKNHLERLKSVLDSKSTERMKQEDIIKQLEAQKEKFKRKLDAIRTDVNRIVDQLAQKRAVLEGCKEKWVIAQSEVTSHREDLEKLTHEMQTQFGDRVQLPLESSISTIESELNELKVLMEEKEKNQHQTLQQAQHDYNESLKVVALKKKILEEEKIVLENLQNSETLRRERYSEIMKNTAHTIASSFTGFLNSRGYGGSLKIDDTNRRLDVTFEKGGEGGKRDLSTCSGGEKSFYQIALLAAIWRDMQAGFVSLDEFDVFMDKVHRRVSMEIVVDAVRSLHDTQCLLISPQEMEFGNVDMTSPDINIYRMPDPQRN